MSQPKSIAVERFEEQQDSESPSNTESERDENSADVPQTAKLDNDQSGSSDEEPPAGENLSEEIYEVEKIVDRRDAGEGLFYLVRWKGFGEADDTWEPAENLSHATKAISEYETSRKVSSKRVRWKGFGEADDTWEPAENLSHATKAISEYETSRKVSSKREMKPAPKTPKLNSRKESVKRQTAPKSVSKRGRPRKASSDISDLESKNSDRDKDNDSDYEKLSKFKKSTLPASYRKRAMTKAALKSHSPSTVKSLESMCFKPPSETTSAANELRQSWLYESDSKNDSGSDREHEKTIGTAETYTTGTKDS
ncbi:Chromo domain-containing protein cec-3 [Parelaphostrongylus tenuis]|uniref:Chromo domain-containing protein cec-3 n=1 Tax=Parelaphostrongylus tenuis TaxID=148309 RepID=A0AAD5QU87_PARTN|nr:Chromo domain-containing protein cec-3 [Parelaphostrongylus tenuis]